MSHKLKSFKLQITLGLESTHNAADIAYSLRKLADSIEGAYPGDEILGETVEGYVFDKQGDACGRWSIKDME